MHRAVKTSESESDALVLYTYCMSCDLPRLPLNQQGIHGLDIGVGLAKKGWRLKGRNEGILGKERLWKVEAL